MTTFENISQVIQQRRSIKPQQMNGKKIDDATIESLIALADQAPTHGHTEPWRFIIYKEAALQQFCRDFAALYKALIPVEKFNELKYQKMNDWYKHVSHLLVVYMQTGSNSKIPEIEERAATAAAIQNILLASTAKHLVSFWSTAFPIYHENFKEYLHLAQQEFMVGLIFLGHTDFPLHKAKRNVPLYEKFYWMK